MTEQETRSRNQRILARLVGREVLHNLCQTIDMFNAQDPDGFLESFYSTFDHEQAALESGWFDLNNAPDQILEAVCKYLGWTRTPSGFANEAALSEATSWPELYAELVDPPYWFNPEDEAYNDTASDWEELCDEECIDLDGHRQEPMEFWAVTDWFARKLRAEGEIVAEVLDFRVWGRCCTGQAIKLDCVIESIADDMGILVGGEHEWKED